MHWNSHSLSKYDSYFSFKKNSCNLFEADYEKQRDNLMFVHNQTQIKLVMWVYESTNQYRKCIFFFSTKIDYFAWYIKWRFFILSSITVAITIGLMILMYFLYLHCKLHVQSRLSTSLNLGPGKGDQECIPLEVSPV